MRYVFVIFILLSLFLAGCDNLKQLKKDTVSLDWFKTQTEYVQKFNRENPNVKKEIWIGKIKYNESFRLTFDDHVCLYSEEKNWFGNYCGKPEAYRFELDTDFLSPELKPGDVVIFVASHQKKKWRNSFYYPHPIDPYRITLIEYAEGNCRITPLQFDTHSWQEKEKFNRLCGVACNGDIAGMEKLLSEEKISPNISWNNVPFLHHWCSHSPNEPEILRQLLKHGAQVNTISKNGNTALSQIANNAWGTRFILSRILLDAGADPNLIRDPSEEYYFSSDGSDPALLWASRWGDLDLLELLLKHGADPNLRWRMPSGSRLPFEEREIFATPLRVAKNKQTVELLKKYGAIIPPIRKGWNPSEADEEIPSEVKGYYSQRRYPPHAIREALKKGASPDDNKITDNRSQPIANCSYDDLAVILLFHPKQESLDAALDNTLFSGQYSKVKLLLEAGANPEAILPYRKESIFTAFSNRQSGLPPVTQNNRQLLIELMLKFGRISND